MGITDHEDYIDRYYLENILQKNGAKCVPELLKKFKFVGADVELVEDILKFGYHHTSESGTDIHEHILNNHVTLVFQKEQ